MGWRDKLKQKFEEQKANYKEAKEEFKKDYAGHRKKVKEFQKERREHREKVLAERQTPEFKARVRERNLRRARAVGGTLRKGFGYAQQNPYARQYVSAIGGFAGGRTQEMYSQRTKKALSKPKKKKRVVRYVKVQQPRRKVKRRVQVRRQPQPQRYNAIAPSGYFRGF